MGAINFFVFERIFLRSVANKILNSFNLIPDFEKIKNPNTIQGKMRIKKNQG